MPIRILVIGTNESYCSQIEEFFEMKGQTAYIIKNYKEGFEKLFFERPHITVIEFTEEEISTSFLNSVKESEHFQLVDQNKYIIEERLNPVFVLQEYNDLKSMYDNIEKAMKNIDFEKNEAPPDESGNLENIFFPKLLKQIESEQRTGLLTLDSIFKTEIFFNRGTPVYSRGSGLETGLGKILLRENKITPEQYEELVSEIDENNSQKTGEILIIKGYISPHDLNTYLELQIKEKIVHSFMLTHGEYHFTHNIGIPDNIYPFKFKVDDIIYEATLRYIDVSSLEKTNLKVIASPKLTNNTSDLNLGPKEMRVVQMLAKQKPFEEIIQNANIEKNKILKLVFFLAMTGLVNIDDIFIDRIGKESFTQMQKKLIYTSNEEPQKDITEEVTDDEEPLLLDEDSIINETSETKPGQAEIKAEEPRTENKIAADISSRETPAEEELSLDIEEPAFTKTNNQVEDTKQNLIKEIEEFYKNLKEDYYGLLQVDENASSSDIKNSYMKLVKKFHPDKILNFPDDVSEKAEEIFSKITLAYETLIDSDRRSEYDSRSELDELKGKASNIFEAEVKYSEGEVLLRHRNYKEAENKFSEAIELNPDEGAYIGAHAWAKFNSSENKESVSAEIVKLIENAIKMDPDYAKNYYYLGSVYKITNNLHKAEKNFEKAVEIDKTLIEAKRELRLIVNRRKERKNQKTDALKDQGLEKRFWSGLFKK